MHKLLINVTATREECHGVAGHGFKFGITGAGTKDGYIISSLNRVLCEAVDIRQRISVIAHISHQRKICQTLIHDQDDVWLFAVQRSVFREGGVGGHLLCGSFAVSQRYRCGGCGI